MKTQDSVDIQTMTPERRRSRKGAWIATFGAILVVALVVGASAIVFAQLSQQHKNAAQPPSGNWVSVLQGYTLSSLAAAHNSPAVLYACATNVQNNSSTSNSTNYTVLRSIDFGTHWQDVGSKDTLGQSCEIAINPTDSNDIFAVGITTGSNGQASPVLHHSTDGGQTWTTIQPKLNVSGSSTPVQWNIQQLSFADNALFGIQWIPSPPMPPVHTGSLPNYFARLSRLLTSTDSGQTWTVIDQQAATKNLSTGSYAVDPANSKTIYELAGTPWLPVQPVAEPNGILPSFVTNEDLYKTTDGGATWQLLQSSQPFGTQVKMAEGNPQTLYLGGVRTPLPYAARGSASNSTDIAQSNFRLQVSSDGGATWHNVPDVPQASIVQGWFVASNGQVFVYAGSGGVYTPIGQPTVSTGTAVASTPAVAPGMTPQSGVVPSILAPTSFQTTPPPVSTATPAPTLQRYDPASNAWSAVTKPPTSGAFMAVTPGDNSSNVLWFLDTSNQQALLYRFIA
jgi:photosystem II stability/assembly factor-like uncharacterized protein